MFGNVFESVFEFEFEILCFKFRTISMVRIYIRKIMHMSIATYMHTRRLLYVISYVHVIMSPTVTVTVNGSGDHIYARTYTVTIYLNIRIQLNS